MPAFKTARRANAIAPFQVMALVARAQELERQGRDLVHLQVGEPDFPTPEPLLRAAEVFLTTADNNRYTPALGLPELRERIAASYHDRAINADHVAVTPGASGALQLAVLALAEPGDEVLVPDPGYPCNRAMIELAGAKPVTLSTRAEANFQPTVADVAAAWTERTRLLMLASPANPTGTVIEPEAILDIARFAAAKGAWVVVDEIYGKLVYQREPVSVALATENIVVVNSFSKYHGMTGSRLGWLVASAPVMQVVERLAQNLFLAPATLAQRVAMSAFEPEVLDELEERRRLFGRRQKKLVQLLAAAGWKVPALPQGAFYVWVELPEAIKDSNTFCWQLLDEASVVVTPGSDFALRQPERYFRIAATTDEARLELGIQRMLGWAAARHG